MENNTTEIPDDGDIFVMDEKEITSQSCTARSKLKQQQQQQTKKRRLQEEHQEEEQGDDRCYHGLNENCGQATKKQRLETTETSETRRIESTFNVDRSRQQLLQPQQQHQRQRQQKHVHWRRKMMTENNNKNNYNNNKEVTEDRNTSILDQSLRCKRDENGNFVETGKKKNIVVKTTTTMTTATTDNGNDKSKNNEDGLHVHNNDDNDANDDGNGHNDEDEDGVYRTWYKLDDPAIVFDDYNDHDIWFTNEDYVSFMKDRIRTIERFRSRALLTFDDLNNNDNSSTLSGNGIDIDKKINSSNSNNNNNNSNISNNADDDQYCMRGLEPFQDHVSHGAFHSKRNLHKSTVMMEQIRQTMLGLKDPGRFRFLVQSQSSLAQFRAVQLAAIDQYDVYPEKPLSSSQRSILTSSGFSSSSESPSLLNSSYGARRQQRRGLESLSSFSHRRFSLPILTSAASTSITSSSPPPSSVPSADHESSDTTNTQPYQLHSCRSYESLSSLVNTKSDDSNGAASLSSKDVLERTNKTTAMNNNLHLRMANRPILTRMATNLPGLMMSSSPEMIQTFQENNARRLMEIYKPLLEESEGDADANATETGGETKPHQSLFRFSLRRDSLSLRNTMSRHRQRCNRQQQQLQSSIAAAMAKSSRFQIRRDSLSHVHSPSSSS